MRMSQADATLFDLPLQNADANKIFPEDLPVHDWYRFVLSFPPHLVRKYLARFGLTDKAIVLDPFCGTGTAIVECQKVGLRSIGIEALPMPAFASRVKTEWNVDPGKLVNSASRIATETLQVLKNQSISDDPGLNESIDPRTLRTLPEDSFHLLLKDSISPLPLHKVLVLKDFISSEKDEMLREKQLLALAKILVLEAGNLKFGPEVGLGRIKHDAAVVQPWLLALGKIAADIASITRRPWQPSKVIQTDSRHLSSIVPPASVDAVFTSPPYPNEKDYTRTTRLETVVLGLARSMADLRLSKKSLVRSNTRSVYVNDSDDDLVRHNSTVQAIAGEIESRRISMGKTSGFERLYHRVTKLYFGGMTQHLSSLRGLLRPGASLAYVVGDQASYLRVMIRTGHILAEIAESLGYVVDAIELFRTRYATATGEQLREEVLILRWPG
jgi:hypothetical protein